MEEKYLEISKQYTKHFGFPPFWSEPSPLRYKHMIEYMLKAIETNIPVHQMLDTNEDEASQGPDPDKIQ